MGFNGLRGESVPGEIWRRNAKEDQPFQGALSSSMNILGDSPGIRFPVHLQTHLCCIILHCVPLRLCSRTNAAAILVKFPCIYALL